MNSVFKISKTGTCGITITGLELDNGEYLKDTDVLISTRNFKYTHCATVNAISTIKYDETKTTKIYEVVDHKLHQIDETTFTVPVDGLYEVTHIIIPNNDWLNYVIETDPQSLYAYKTIMFYDTVNKKIKEFKIISNPGDPIASEINEVTIEKLLTTEGCTPVILTDKPTSVIRGDKNTFYTCYLNDCFYTILKKLYPLLTKKYDNSSDFKELIYKRDLLWMTIHAIKYAIETSQLFEAQRMLEDITLCNFICSKTELDKIITGCGCNN